MGWTNSHLHHFIIHERYYGIPRDDDWQAVIDERHTRLADVAPVEKSAFVYEYDFGDSWEHDVLVETIAPPSPDEVTPRGLGGQRACPPEDVGGVWGYESLLEALAAPGHPEHASSREWAGDDFDPEAFDLDAINQALQHIDQRVWWDGP